MNSTLSIDEPIAIQSSGSDFYNVALRARMAVTAISIGPRCYPGRRTEADVDDCLHDLTMAAEACRIERKPANPAILASPFKSRESRIRACLGPIAILLTLP